MGFNSGFKGLICGSVESRWDNTKLFVYKLQLYYEFGTHFDFVICSYFYLYSLIDHFFLLDFR